MAYPDRRNEKRGIGRRKEDRVVRDHNNRYKQLFNVGQIITSEMNMDTLFEVIMDQTNQIMDTERSSVFLNDADNNELWSLVATGMGKNEIRIKSDSGIAGWVFQRKTPLVINDVYSDRRFFSVIDSKSGFRTVNILCIPIINRSGQCIGVLQTLNKRSGDFEDRDIELLESITHYVAIALENSRLFEDVKTYSNELEATLVRIETLEKVKGQLTKFVPHSVAKMIERDPDQLASEKTLMDVSILFIDIEGFSTITERFDQRLVNDMVECHFSRYLECIGRHSGEVNETSGDGLMVMFKEGNLSDHTKEAVLTGLEIIDENMRLNEEFTYPWGKIHLHLGINSGQALVGATKMKSLAGERWTYTASGLVTVLAARIGALSNKSRLYIGHETYKYVEKECTCEFIGRRKLKNVQEPLPIYRVTKGMA
jgi:class 3 adenylate cyclase/putative methionine-R-sulfoxide reductase with GAF domain